MHKFLLMLHIHNKNNASLPVYATITFYLSGDNITGKTPYVNTRVVFSMGVTYVFGNNDN